VSPGQVAAWGCSDDGYDCKDFDAYAQACYDCCRSLAHRYVYRPDGDEHGVVCEELGRLGEVELHLRG